MFVEYGLALLPLLLLLEVWRSHRKLRRDSAPRPMPAKLDQYPSVTVVRPVRGLDVGAEANIQSAFATGYPGEVQILFVFDDRTELALPLVEQAIDVHRAAGGTLDVRVVFAGEPPRGRTGKLNAMIVGLEVATGELVAFADSDIRPEPGALTTLVETLLETPGAGSAFAPAISSVPPATFGDAGYALLLNGLYGSAASSAARRLGGELPFIMGQFMIFKRSALAAIGGLESADGQLVDDMYLGRRVTAAGYRNRVSPRPVPVIQRGLPLQEFVSVYRRWITFSRSGLPGWSFKLTSLLHGVVFWVGLGGAALAVARGLWLAALLNLLAPLAVSESISSLDRVLGGATLKPGHRLVAFALLLGAPLVFLSIFLHRRVAWRGRTYALSAGSVLAAPQTPHQGEPPLRPDPV